MSSLALCAGARAAASSPIKPVTESLLECDVDISPPPAFLSNTFYHIIQSPTHTDKTFFEDLVYLLKCVDPVPGVTLSIAVALMETVDKASWKRMSTELIDAEFRFEDVEIDTLILYFPPYNNLIDPTREAFRHCIGSHYVYGFSLLMTIIGKYLHTANYRPWLTKRRSSFANPLSLPKDDPKLLLFEPTIQTCQAFNREARGLWQIRRQFFCEVWSQAKGSSLLARGLQVTLVLLKYAEFTNFQFPWNWIVILNPVLLMWAELNREIPFLAAAYAKFYSLDDKGPYAKLILPQDQLEEFAAPRLNNLYQVAKAIASEFGPPSISQITSGPKTTYIQDLCNKALVIVRAAGAAKTVDSDGAL